MLKLSLPASFIALFLMTGGIGGRAQGLPGAEGPPPLHPPFHPPAHGRDHIDARVGLSRPDPAVDEDAEGHIHLKAHKGRSAIHVHVRHLTPGAVYSVEFEKDGVSGIEGLITIPVRERSPRVERCLVAELDGAQEVPPVMTDAAGKARLRLEGRGGTVLRYEVKVEGLSGPAIGAHIHTGAPGEAGGVLIPLDHETLRGKVEITPEQVEAIGSGNTYVNVHTEANPGGEIRGQIVSCVPPLPLPPGGNGALKIDTGRGDQLPLGAARLEDLLGATISVIDPDAEVVLFGTIESLERPALPAPTPPAPRCFFATLDGDQEVPPVMTEASGRAEFRLVGRERTVLRYELEVEGLSGPPVGAHIHPGAPGETGGVLIPLDHETLRGEVEVTPEHVAAIESGNTYVNVHTAANPGGEIRGQLEVCGPRPPRRGDDGEEADDEGAPAGGHALVLSDLFFEEFDFDMPGSHDSSFLRGDVNMDGTVDIADPIGALHILFLGAALPYCPDAVDSNDDGVLDIADPVATLLSLFGGEGPLSPPGADGAAGFDATPDDLLCHETF